MDFLAKMLKKRHLASASAKSVILRLMGEIAKAKEEKEKEEDKKEEIKKRQQESEFRISIIRTELFTIVVLVYYY